MSADFFNQQFSPAEKKATTSSTNGTTIGRPPPPPPPPPRSGNAPSSGNLHPRKAPYSGGSMNIGNGNASSSAPNSRSAYYGQKSSSSSSTLGAPPNPPPRPTGNYYSTGPANNATSTPASNASFYNMSGTNTTNTTTTSSSSSTSNDQGWYGSSSSSSSNPYGAPDPYATTTPTPTATIPSSNTTTTDTTENNPYESSNYYGTQPNTNNSTTANDNDTTLNGFNPSTRSTSSSSIQEQQQQPEFSKRSDSLEYLASTVPTNDDNLQGPMSAMSPSASINIMQPSTSSTSINSTTGGTIGGGGGGYNPVDFENEPPLLEELGINLDQISAKSLAVILPLPTNIAQKYNIQNDITTMMEDADLIGPIIYALCLGMELLLVGKIHFESIYGLTLFGVVCMTLILNLMSPSDSISLWTVVSVLGYSLLPVNLLAAVNILISVQKMGRFGWLLAWMTILWCTISSTRLFEKGCGFRDQRYLVGYPNALLYSAFVMLTIF